MTLDAVGVLVLAIGAVLAMLAYLVVELGRTQETTLGLSMERELATAVFDPASSGGSAVLETADQEEDQLAWALAETEPYTYRRVPTPTPESSALPGWLVRELVGVDACHALDAEDQLVLFLRVAEGASLLNSPLNWSCNVARDWDGLMLELAFAQGRKAYVVQVPFRFDDSRHLRHAIRLTQQDVVRVDVIVQSADHRLRHGGCRLVVVPAPVLQHVRKAVLAYIARRDDV